MRLVPGWAVGAAAVVVTVAQAAPSPAPACPALFAGRPMALSLDALPAAVVTALDAKFAAGEAAGGKPIAPRDADWGATDVVSAGRPVPGRRFIGAGRRGTAWFVWYERGGIAHTYVAAVFELADGAGPPRRIAHVQTTLDKLCAATIALLDSRGDRTPDGNDW
ncbi:MAG: hypothetical protein JO047_15290 [Alphaproteobacteria bacterium]|nr:hypothetical protein [Alphaproteobacteria bacterium]